MKHVAPLALVFASLASLACAVAPEDAQQTDEGDAQEFVAPVVLNIGIDQLHVARFDLDLEANIARFVEPAATLPLDRVTIFGAAPGDEPSAENLFDLIESCNIWEGRDITGGEAFVVGQGEGGGDILGQLSGCVPCGWTRVCPGRCNNLGPGEVPGGPGSADPATYDTDPAEGDSGVDNGSGGGSGDSEGGGTGGSGGSSGDSGSGADSGGSGGSHGGVGQPGGGD